MNSQGIRLSAILTVLGYAALVFALLVAREAVGLALWTVSPLALPLITTLAARKKRTQLAALSLLLCLTIVGAVLLLWGLVWNPGDYNHLVAVFLPFYQFGFIAVVLVVLVFATLVRRYVR